MIGMTLRQIRLGGQKIGAMVVPFVLLAESALAELLGLWRKRRATARRMLLAVAVLCLVVTGSAPAATID